MSPGGNSIVVDSQPVTTAILKAPILSHSGKFLFVAGAGNGLVALEAETGQIAWRAETNGSISSNPQVSPDDLRLYFITEGGVLESRDQQNGALYWQFHCDNMISNCAPNVQAEFSLSPDGMTLYYGDIEGNIRALQLGRPIEPRPPLTDYPTVAPLPTISLSPTTVGYTQPPVRPPAPEPTLAPFQIQKAPASQEFEVSAAGSASLSAYAASVAGVALINTLRLLR